MKTTATEDVMIQRRLERLERVRFAMCDPRVPETGRRYLSLFACHNLLTGFSQNSLWRTAWYCVGRAVQESRTVISIRFRLRWYRLLRLSEDQIDERFAASRKTTNPPSN
jgi:hypothetical protein